MRLRLEQRPQASSTWRWLSPVLAVVLTLLTGALMFALLGQDVLRALEVFLVNPMKSRYAWSELLLKATPLAICAAGLAIGFRANVWNIGAEGQFIVGAITATVIALYVDAGHVITLTLMMLAGVLGGAAWAGIAAWLKNQFNANEILVSLMLVYVANLLASWLVFGPLRDPMGLNFPQTVMFEDYALLPVILTGTRLNMILWVTIGVLIATYILMYRTELGFRMRLAGESAQAARYAGISAHRMVWLGLLIGGGCAGLAGMAEVAGPMGQLTDRISNGYGFAAIIVAFVGRLSPLGIALASLVMALFFIGGEQSQQYLGLPGSISMVFQGLLLFYLLACDVLIRFRLTVGSKRAAQATRSVQASS